MDLLRASDRFNRGRTGESVMRTPILDRTFSRFDLGMKTEANRHLDSYQSTKSVLTDRLKDLVILELKKDGDREYRTMTLRDLYDYVLQAITAKRSTEGFESGRPGRQRSVSISNNDHELSMSGTSRPSRDVRATFRAGDPSMNLGKEEVTYRERLGGYLHPRDMRRLVSPFSSSNEPELIVRRHVMLLNFDPLRAIVLRDRLLVFVPDGADSILIDLEKRVRGGQTELCDELFGPSPGNSSDVEYLPESLQQAQSDSHNGMGRLSQNVKNRFKKIVSHEKNEGLDLVTPEANRKEVSDGDKVDESKSSSTVSSVKKVNFEVLKNKWRGNGTESGLSAENNSAISSQSADGTSNYDTPIEEASSYGEEDDEHSSASVLSEEFDEFDELNDQKWIDLPFELQCVDAVLQAVVALLSTDVNDLRDNTYEIVNNMLYSQRSSIEGDSAQDTLRRLKNAVGEMVARVQGFVRAMNLVLDEDEDLALMNLSRLITHPDRFIQPVSSGVLHEESDEPELILEAYLQQGLSSVNALELLKGVISHTDELVNQKLDSIRNRLLYVNTLVSLLSLCVASASLVGSFMGMNLTNHLETDENAFRQFVIYTLVGCFGMLLVLIIFFLQIGALPKNI